MNELPEASSPAVPPRRKRVPKHLSKRQPRLSSSDTVINVSSNDQEQEVTPHVLSHVENAGTCAKSHFSADSLTVSEDGNLSRSCDNVAYLREDGLFYDLLERTPEQTSLRRIPTASPHPPRHGLTLQSIRLNMGAAPSKPEIKKDEEFLDHRWHLLHLDSARLEATSATSELFAAFAMVALVEMQINMPCTVPDIAWVLFSINTTALVGINILALTVSTHILPDVQAVTKIHSHCLLDESHLDKSRNLVQSSWIASSFLGLALFFLEVVLVAWVKFWDLAIEGVITSACIVFPALVIFISMAVHIYRAVEVHHTRPFSSQQAAPSPSLPKPNSTFMLDALSVISRGDEEDEMTTRGLVWRRLHVALARLQAASSTSELISGFAMMAMIELQTNTPTHIPRWMFTTLAVNTTVLVLIHVFALMITTFLLPSLHAVERGPKDSRYLCAAPNERMKQLVSSAWACSTLLGMLLFLAEVAILCWIKFWDFSFDAAASSSAVVLLSSIVFACFALHFWRVLVEHKHETANNQLRNLEIINARISASTD